MAAVLSLLLALIWFGQAADGVLEPAEGDVFQQDVAWSPDGRWLAFSDYSGGRGTYRPDKWSVYVVGADGSGRRLLVENALYVTWSPDGRRMAFIAGGPCPNSAIYVANADGTGARKIVN